MTAKASRSCFDSIDMTPVLLETGKSKRYTFTENGLSPLLSGRAASRQSSIFVVTMDRPRGGLAVDSNLGWKGGDKYVVTLPQLFDLWGDPQERYDIFMNNDFFRSYVGEIVSCLSFSCGREAWSAGEEFRGRARLA